MSATERIVSTILLRDAYREVRMHYLVRMVFTAAVLLAFSSMGTAALLAKEDAYLYVLLERGGRVMKMVPLDEQNRADEFVVNWAVNAAVQAHTFDFRNYPSQFQTAQKNLTVFGWRSYEEALRESGNFTAVMRNRYAVTAVPTGPGHILKKGHLMGRFAWRIEFPMLVTYQSSLHATSQNLKVTLVVVRQPEYVQPDGLGIRSIIAE